MCSFENISKKFLKVKIKIVRTKRAIFIGHSYLTRYKHTHMGVCTYCRKHLKKKSVISRIFRENCKGMKMNSFSIFSLTFRKVQNRNVLLATCKYHLLRKYSKIKRNRVSLFLGTF